MIYIPKGKTGKLELTVNDIPEAGRYSGKITFYLEESECRWDVPIHIDANKTGQVKVLDSDKELKVKIVAPSWLNGIVPKKIRHDGLYFRIENDGTSTIVMDTFTVSLKGNATENIFTEEDITWANEDKSIPPQAVKVVQLKIDPKHRLNADEYTGFVRLFFKDYPQSITVPVTMHTRISLHKSRLKN